MSAKQMPRLLSKPVKKLAFVWALLQLRIFRKLWVMYCADSSPIQKDEPTQLYPLAIDKPVSLVILTGFTYGYRDFMSNLMCQFRQLGVMNYAIAAFDAHAQKWCVDNFGNACLSGPTLAVDDPSLFAHQYGSPKFNAITKLKSQHVLRLLELGHDVLWSDVDISWTRDPIPYIVAEMGDADIAVQSNAPPEEIARNGRRRINSGFYYVRQSNASVQAFQAIVDHAIYSKESEQPSFYSVLCGDDMEYAAGPVNCLRSTPFVKTYFLDRKLFPNGAVIYKSEVDPYVSHIMHFNWCIGREEKRKRFVDAGRWMLDERGRCISRQIAAL